MESLHWRHNDHDSVSNHQPHGCLLNRLFRRRSKKTPKLRVTGLCVGNSPGPVNSPHKGPVTRKMFLFDDVIMIHLYKYVFIAEYNGFLHMLHLIDSETWKKYRCLWFKGPLGLSPNSFTSTCYDIINWSVLYKLNAFSRSIPLNLCLGSIVPINSVRAKKVEHDWYIDAMPRTHQYSGHTR